MYYGRNVDAFLYMGQSTAASLPAPGSDVFDEVPLVQRITPPATAKQSGSFNVLNDRVKRSVGGKTEDQFVEGTLVIDNDDQVVINIRADLDAAGDVRRNFRIVYPDGYTENFVGFFTGFTPEELDANADAEEHRAGFRISIDGAITRTNAGSLATA